MVFFFFHFFFFLVLSMYGFCSSVPRIYPGDCLRDFSVFPLQVFWWSRSSSRGMGKQWMWFSCCQKRLWIFVVVVVILIDYCIVIRTQGDRPCAHFEEKGYQEIYRSSSLCIGVSPAPFHVFNMLLSVNPNSCLMSQLQIPLGGVSTFPQSFQRHFQQRLQKGGRLRQQ